MKNRMICLLCLLSSQGIAGAAGNGNRVKPGEFIIDHPTLINLGFEWLIQGDDNRNAAVAVSYRKQGETAWKTGMPLVRLQNERVWQPSVFNLVTPNMFAGSILDLEPGTAYEARFVLTDPAGAPFGVGAAIGTNTVATTSGAPSPRSTPHAARPTRRIA
jgi:hypothetical protein